MTNDEVLQQIRHLIGSRYVPSVETYISELTGRENIRSGLVGTTDLHPERLNIQQDSAGNIESFSFY
ncbi:MULTISPECIES: hypothetical protein [unclassified Pseudomonas]|uniref:hypothetical protein n=1 Tax=unclassified Pseudomonas TaxID=196821 RepID=UPI0030DB45FF